MINEILPVLDKENNIVVIDTEEIEQIGEPVLFLLEDIDKNQSVLALSTLIELLEVAESLGRVPRLPAGWYNVVVRENGD